MASTAWLRTEHARRDQPAAWATPRDWLHERLYMHVDVDEAIDDRQFVGMGSSVVAQFRCDSEPLPFRDV